MSEISSFRGEHLFLSNFFHHSFEYNGMTWVSSEHAYQAAKVDPSDKATILKIAQAQSPGLAKKIGQQVPLREGWEDIKVDEMRKILNAKFSDPDLRAKLIATGDAELIEGNTWWDFFWGCVKDEDDDWAGKNMLGKLLMEIRAEQSGKVQVSN